MTERVLGWKLHSGLKLKKKILEGVRWRIVLELSIVVPMRKFVPSGEVRFDRGRCHCVNGRIVS